MECSVEGCERPVLARGWCSMHYQRQKNGRPLGSAAPLSLHYIPWEQRFWDAVQQDDETGCWSWKNSTKGSSGYGVIRRTGQRPKAHRVAWELLVGPIPEGMELDHLCRNRRCVNPGHLEPVPPGVNKLRGEGIPAKNARKTHCKRGHPLEGPDADLVPDLRLGRRICRKCVHIHRRTRYLRHGK